MNRNVRNVQTNATISYSLSSIWIQPRALGFHWSFVITFVQVITQLEPVHFHWYFYEWFHFDTVRIIDNLPYYAHVFGTLQWYIQAFGSWGSSVSIVSDSGLGNRGSIPGRGKSIFSSSLCVQTGSGVHPASCPKGPGGPFPGAKARPGRDADHSPPSSAEVKN
jgi:hypothetical protein